MFAPQRHWTHHRRAEHGCVGVAMQTNALDGFLFVVVVVFFKRCRNVVNINKVSRDIEGDEMQWVVGDIPTTLYLCV